MDCSMPGLCPSPSPEVVNLSVQFSRSVVSNSLWPSELQHARPPGPSPTQWTWVWVDSGSWWWTGRPGVLRFMGSQRVGHNWATKLNWTELTLGVPFSVSYHFAFSYCSWSSQGKNAKVVCHQHRCQVPLSLFLIQEKAKSLYEDLKKHSKESEGANFNASYD